MPREVILHFRVPAGQIVNLVAAVNRTAECGDYVFDVHLACMSTAVFVAVLTPRASALPTHGSLAILVGVCATMLPVSTICIIRKLCSPGRGTYVSVSSNG